MPAPRGTSGPSCSKRLTLRCDRGRCLLAGEAGNGSSPLVAAIDLYWIPLGPGEVVVRVSGKVFEAVSALVQRRPVCDLSHSALVVIVPEGRFVIEMAPIPDLHGRRRGVVAEGPVGTRWVGRFRPFRYEIRRWEDGVIPDAQEAASTVRVDIDLAGARRLLDLVPSVPTPVWGRNELDAGEMWNSNSVTSWLLGRAGVAMEQIESPPGGRAPGWGAGLAVARRHDKCARPAERPTPSADVPRDHDVAGGSLLPAGLGPAAGRSASWRSGSRSLQDVLLRSSAAGVSSPYLHQPAQVDERNPRLAKTFGSGVRRDARLGVRGEGLSRAARSTRSAPRDGAE